MNAIISLCHFCELHGPTVLFCTQAFHSDKPQFDEHLESYDVREENQTSSSCNTGSNMWTSQASVTSSEAVPSNKPKPAEMCEACRSLASDQPGYVSKDPETSVRYVSSQYPLHPGVYSIIRQACLRSLSHEVCPGREGPIFFGDERRGQVLSHTFVIRDENARGSQRLYSVIVVMMDKIFLLSSWPFLLTHISSIIQQIKAKIVDPGTGGDSVPSTSDHRPVLRHQHNGRKLNKLRSFRDITGDADIFEKLHQAFSSILRAGGCRLTERLLEGPPTEDSVIDFDRQEDTDEGFVKLFRRSVVDSIPHDAPSLNDDDEDVESDNKSVHVFTGLRNLLKVLEYSRFHVLAHHVVRGSHIVIRAQQKQLVKSVIDSLRTLLPKGCCNAVYFTSKLEDWGLCNFIGMPLHVLIPENPPGVDLILEISEPRLDRFEHQGRNRMTESMIERSVDENISDLKSRHYNIETPSNIRLPNKAPTVLQKIEKALLNEELADSVVDECITCLKEEWMMKVKAMYKFTKVGGSRSREVTQKLLQVVGARDEDKVILEFWMSGLSDKYRSIDT